MQRRFLSIECLNAHRFHYLAAIVTLQLNSASRDDIKWLTVSEHLQKPMNLPNLEFAATVQASESIQVCNCTLGKLKLELATFLTPRTDSKTSHASWSEHSNLWVYFVQMAAGQKSGAVLNIRRRNGEVFVGMFNYSVLMLDSKEYGKSYCDRKLF